MQGQLRGVLKDVKELLLDEWSVGSYYRDLPLPAGVDGEHANVSYGNGVLVVALPLVNRTRPAELTLTTAAPSRGERAGNAGHPPV
jgi:HSP20 family protein